MSLYDSLIESVIYEDSTEEYKARVSLNNILFNESFEISAKEINKITNGFNISNSLLEAQIDSLLEASQTKFDKFGLNSSKMNSTIKKYGTEIGKTIKEEGITKSSRSKIADLFDKAYNDIERFNENKLGVNLTDAEKEKLKKFDNANVLKSIGLILEIIISQLFCTIILSIIFGPAIGNFLVVTFVAPITEETAKSIAIKNKYATEFTVIFNIFEASGYIIGLKGAGVPFANALRTRILAVGMHISTTIVEWLSTNPKVLEKLGIDKDDEEAKKKTRFIGQVIGMIIHFAWNLAGVKSLKFNSAITGLPETQLKAMQKAAKIQ